MLKMHRVLGNQVLGVYSTCPSVRFQRKSSLPNQTFVQAGREGWFHTADRPIKTKRRQETLC